MTLPGEPLVQAGRDLRLLVVRDVLAGGDLSHRRQIKEEATSDNITLCALHNIMCTPPAPLCTLSTLVPYRLTL